MSSCEGPLRPSVSSVLVFAIDSVFLSELDDRRFDFAQVRDVKIVAVAHPRPSASRHARLGQHVDHFQSVLENKALQANDLRVQGGRVNHGTFFTVSATKHLHIRQASASIAIAETPNTDNTGDTP